MELASLEHKNLVRWASGCSMAFPNLMEVRSFARQVFGQRVFFEGSRDVHPLYPNTAIAVMGSWYRCEFHRRSLVFPVHICQTLIFS
jgi:hypothetical protein